MARFQSFQQDGDSSKSKERLLLLREELRRRGLDGLIVPRSDDHQSEYVASHLERLCWLTGFSGSAGNALILPDRAIIVVDGRYTLQVREEIDLMLFEPVAQHEQTLEDWIAGNTVPGTIIAYDPWLHTQNGVKKLQAAVEKAGAMLVASDVNLVDIIRDVPEPVTAPLVNHPIVYAGEKVENKIQRIREILKAEKSDALFVSDPHSLAWIFNFRGGDIAHTPLAMGYGIVYPDRKAQIFLDYAPIPDDVRSALAPFADFLPREHMMENLDELGKEGKRVRFDEATAGYALIRRLEAAGGETINGEDPVTLMKACKNKIEIEGARRAHKWDGLAMVRFLAWLDEVMPSGKLSEIEAVEALEHFRLESRHMRDISFATIAGAGPNAAICHYHVNEQTNRILGRDEIFLIDSGAQYPDGTTDITRTLIAGRPTTEMKERFTLVLKGMIALSRAIFPQGTSGIQLDILARQFLWQNGLDFDHGTGHGVGSYLSVHEGPQRIAKTSQVPLRPGMIVSNEPGYYKNGHYGIRIENLLLVEKRENPQADRIYYGFETLTYVPIEKKLMDIRLISTEEKNWINSYHKKVYELYATDLDEKTLAWLAGATSPID